MLLFSRDLLVATVGYTDLNYLNTFTTVDIQSMALKLFWRLAVFLLILLLMISGIAIFVWRPIYFKPPFFRYSHIVYSLICLSWLPMLLASFLLWPLKNHVLPMVKLIVTAQFGCVAHYFL
jgi:hypothetical protein